MNESWHRAVLSRVLLLLLLVAATRAQDEPTPVEVDVGAAVGLAMEKLVEADGFIKEGEILKAVHRIKWADDYLEGVPDDHAGGVYARGVSRLLMGEALLRNGQTGQAMTWFDEAARQFLRLEGEQASQKLRHAVTRTLEAALALNDSETLLRSCRNLYEIDRTRGANSETLVEDLNNVAVALKHLGRFGEANQVLESAEEQIAGGDVSIPRQALHHYHRGLIYNDRELPARAIPHFEKSLALYRALPDTEVQQAECLLDLAGALRDHGRSDEADASLREGIQLARERPEGKSIALALQVAMLVASNEIESDPESYLVRAQALEEEASDLQGLEKIRLVCLQNMTAVLAQLHRYEEATAFANQALELLPAIPDRSRYSQEIHRTLGILYALQERPREANAHLLQNVTGGLATLAADLPGMTDLSRYTRIDGTRPLIEVIHTLSFARPAGDPLQGLQAALWSKALYAEACRREHPMLHRPSTPERRARIYRYLELRRRLSSRALDYGERTDDSDSAALTHLAEEMRDLEIALRGDPEVYRAEFRFRPTSAEDVISRLTEDSVLLEFVVYDPPKAEFCEDADPQYGVYAIRRSDRAARAIPLGPCARIDDAILEYRETLGEQQFRDAKDEQALREQAAAIRKLLLDPVLPSLEGVERIYVAPDGLIGLVSFEALPIETSRYLVEEIEVVYLTTGRDLAGETLHGPSPGSAWLVGDPSYDAMPEERIAALRVPPSPDVEVGPPTGGGGRSIGQWERIPKTRTAIRSIAAHTRKAGMETIVLLDAGASEESLWEARSPRVLVLATHGSFLREPPTVHIDFRAEGGAGRLNEDFMEAANPLQRNMLILAGANRSDRRISYRLAGNRAVQFPQGEETAEGNEREVGDGRLTAYEVWGMDLHGTELVVLLACESGIGVTGQGETAPGLCQPQGEGVAGLRQAFMVAGARSVVMSLWKVPDEDSTRQIAAFFEGWLVGSLGRYEAFHAAQLRALQRAREDRGNSHPYWWAGFVYTGVPDDRAAGD